MSEAARRPEAVIIAVGSELVQGRIVDTNSAWIAGRLGRNGIDVAGMISVADDADRIEHTVREVKERGPAVIIITGGLGPTHDDITAPAVAAALGMSLAVDETALEAIRYVTGFTTPADHHLKQATLPVGSRMLRPVGTAPGFIVSSAETTLVVLPGVPSELKEMWEEVEAGPEFADLGNVSPRVSSTMILFGTGEPPVDDALGELIADKPSIRASICSRYGEVVLLLDYPQEESPAAAAVIAGMRERFAGNVIAGGETAAESVIGRLAESGMTLAVAESCTGGLLSGAITDVSGASAVFLGGVVAYDNRIKVEQLGVREDILDNAGAVSEPVAQWMAVGARTRLGADYGIGITGIAGPNGGSAEKPVGLVYICISAPGNDVVRRFDFKGDRSDVRRAAVAAAIAMLHEAVSGD